MREWQDEVQRGLRADVYEGFANTDLDNGDLQAIFGVLPPHNQWSQEATVQTYEPILRFNLAW